MVSVDVKPHVSFQHVAGPGKRLPFRTSLPQLVTPKDTLRPSCFSCADGKNKQTDSYPSVLGAVAETSGMVKPVVDARNVLGELVSVFVCWGKRKRKRRRKITERFIIIAVFITLVSENYHTTTVHRDIIISIYRNYHRVSIY